MKNIQVTIDIGPIGPLAVKGGNKSAQSARWQLKNTSIGQIGLWQLKVTSIGQIGPLASIKVNPFSAKATFLSFLANIDKRVLYAKTQFAIDTVNIYFNRQVTKLFEIHDFKV